MILERMIAQRRIRKQFPRCQQCLWSSRRWFRKGRHFVFRKPSEYWAKEMKADGKEDWPYLWCVVPIAAGSGVFGKRGNIVTKGIWERSFYYKDFPELQGEGACPHCHHRRAMKPYTPKKDIIIDATREEYVNAG